MRNFRLSALIYGHPGSEKTRSLRTTFEPRLILDAENGAQYLPGHKVWWEPERVEGGRISSPPETTETVIVPVRSFSTLEIVWEYLNEYDHNFRTVAIDSITEAQKRGKDIVRSEREIKKTGETGGFLPTTNLVEKDWDLIGTALDTMVRRYRDLCMHPTHPIEMLIITALAAEKNGRYGPFVQGSFRYTLPAHVDLVGYTYHNDDNEPALLVGPHQSVETKVRTGGLDSVIINPDFTKIYGQISNYIK